MHPRLTTLAACIAVAAPALAQLTGPATIESVSGCAAVVSSVDICSTCVTAACVVPATITAGCGTCAPDPPTIYRSFPCERGCDALSGCQTVYSVVTATTGVACAASPTPTGTEDAEDPATSVSTAAAARMKPLRWW